MTSKNHNALFSKKLYDELPVFYRFLRKTSKAVSDKIEYGDTKTSLSTLHRSTTYFIYETYVPHTKFNMLKKMIK